MRIALAISSLAAGGAEKNLAVLADHLAEQGHAVDLLTFAPTDAVPHYTLDERVRLHNLDLAQDSSGLFSGIANNLKRIRKLRSVLRLLAPHVLVAFGDQTNILCLFAALGLNVPVIVSERVDPGKHSPGRFWGTLRSLTYPLASRIVVQAPAFADSFSPRLRSRIVSIENPVFPPAPPRGELHLPEKTILAAGRLDWQKGFDILIRAFAQAGKAHPGWSLWIFGEGAERPRLEKLALSLHCNGEVYFPGQTNQLGLAMAQATIFALSSRYEGQPNVLAEALAHGLPVVATSCPGVVTMLDSDVNGLLVAQEDEEQLSTALARLMGDGALRVRLAQAAPGVLVKFAPKTVLPKWEKLIEQVACSSARS
jgi:glycosyltransferase involved in cell wall biosynthesis